MFGRYVVLKVKYADAPAYDGMKVLVYKASIGDLWQQRSLDPHFVTKPGYICPVARFPANAEGWQDALDYAKRKDAQ